MATYVIGDLQGCYEQLIELLTLIAPSTSDKLWFTGDLVNRGPKSLETLRCIQSLGAQAIAVLGNHDLHLLAVAAKVQHIKSKDTFHDVLAAKDADSLLHWLQQLPLLHYDTTLNTVLVHAGIPPQWSLAQAQQCAHDVELVLQQDPTDAFFDHMYGEYPHRWSDDLTGWDRVRFITNALTRMRFCTIDGDLEFHHKHKHGVPEHLIPWFEHPAHQTMSYDIVFGHWAALEGKTHHPQIHAIDTGCVWGKELTALRLEDRHYFSVPGYVGD